MSKDISKLTEREKCELGMLYDANYSEETVKLRLKCQGFALTLIKFVQAI